MGRIKNNASKRQKDIILKRTAQNEENETVEIAIPATVYFSNSGRMLVNSPGLGVCKDGENGKFGEVAAFLQELDVASVILYQSSLADFAFKKVNMEALLMDNLRTVLSYATSNAQVICGSNKPVLFVSGHSAGASTTAAVGPENPQVSKMLLISPSGDIDPSIVKESLSKYAGELYVISGDKDYVISPEAAHALAEWATKAKIKRIVTVPDCDHDFSGERNGQLFSEAYLWAFKRDGTLHAFLNED